jgi:hypothetical protein
VADADAAAIATVIAEDHLQDRGFAGARGTRQHHAFARLHIERDAAHDRQFDPTLQMHDEGLFGVRNVDHRSHWGTHGGRIEETSSCV